MQKIIEMVINLIFLGFGNKLKGYKTIIANVILGLLGLIEFATGKVHTFFCDQLHVGCEATVWATLATVAIYLNLALRYVTDTAAGKAQ